METLIRTPDMPGVHQITQSDGFEDRPSYDNYEVSSRIEPSYNEERNYDWNTKTLLYLNPEEYVKKIYASYNDFIEAVHKSVESGAGIIWDTYQQFVKLKSANPNKYYEALEEMKKINSNSYFCTFKTNVENLTKNKNLKKELTKDYFHSKDECCDEKIDQSINDSFRMFFTNVLNDNHNNDIPALLNNDSYLDEIAKLRFSLQTMESNFKFDVENCVEYTAHRSDCYFSTAELNSIAFKIKPFITRVSLTPGNSIYDSLPVIDYKVCIDMHKLISWLMNNCKMPDELPEMLNDGETVREEYIKMVLGEIPSFSEKFARRIIIELFDMYHNIRGNWRKFLEKFINSYSRLREYPEITNLINKANYLANLSSRKTEVGVNYGYDRLQTGTTTELFIEIFKRINSVYDFDNQFVSQMFDALSYVSANNDGEFIINQATVLFRKTFSVFFEDAVLTKFITKWQTEHYNKTITVESYTREFYRTYDIVDLLGKASSISDYNIKDFIQTIISECRNCKMSIYDPGKLSNGEYMFFMYSKLSRKIWMDLTNSLIILSRLVSATEQLDIRKESDEKICDSIAKTINDFKEFIYGTLINMLTEARFLPNTNIGWGAYKCKYLAFEKSFAYCRQYIKPVVSSDTHKFDVLIKDVLKTSENKEQNGVVDNGFIVSYDVSDRDKYELKHNFTMALQRRGLVGLDF